MRRRLVITFEPVGVAKVEEVVGIRWRRRSAALVKKYVGKPICALPPRRSCTTPMLFWIAGVDQVSESSRNVWNASSLRPKFSCDNPTRKRARRYDSDVWRI